jgi:hypothetical protein
MARAALERPEHGQPRVDVGQARRATGYVDPLLLSSEQTRLVEEARRLALS